MSLSLVHCFLNQYKYSTIYTAIIHNSVLFAVLFLLLRNLVSAFAFWVMTLGKAKLNIWSMCGLLMTPTFGPRVRIRRGSPTFKPKARPWAVRRRAQGPRRLCQFWALFSDLLCECQGRSIVFARCTLHHKSYHRPTHTPLGTEFTSGPC